MTELCQTLLMVSAAYGQGHPGERMKGKLCIHPPAILKNVFDEYNFSIILNFFDNNEPYALSTHNRKRANKMQHIWRSTQN